MGKFYDFYFMGGPRDGKSDSRHLSREEFVSYLERVPKQGPPPPGQETKTEPHYELVSFNGDTFVFEWITPK